jgi:hypothetical protein
MPIPDDKFSPVFGIESYGDKLGVHGTKLLLAVPRELTPEEHIDINHVMTLTRIHAVDDG